MTALGPGDVAGRLGNLGVIPVATVTDAGQAEPLFEALCAGGLPVIEVTLRAPAATEVVRQLAEAHPDALIGAGTVLSVRDAATVMDFGAKFVVSPVTDPDVVRECAARGVPALPGACTPTEVHTAQLAGAELVKFFPAEALGTRASYVRLQGPCPPRAWCQREASTPATWPSTWPYPLSPRVAAVGWYPRRHWSPIVTPR